MGPAVHCGKEQNASHGNPSVPLLQATGPARCFTQWVLETSTALMGMVHHQKKGGGGKKLVFFFYWGSVQSSSDLGEHWL